MTSPLQTGYNSFSNVRRVIRDMNFKKVIVFISLLAILLNPIYISANEAIFVNYVKKDIVVQNAHRYYPFKPVLDKLKIKSKVERTGSVTKIVLTEGSKTYQITLDEEAQLAYTPKGQFSYIVNNNRIGFTSNFYATMLKESNLSWHSKTNALSIYEKKPKGALLINLEEYKSEAEDLTVKKPVVLPNPAPVQSVVPAPAPPSTSTSTPSYVPYEKGQATWYGAALHGNFTASGERFDMNALTAAHKTLPFGTKVKVTNLNNKSSIVVRITDRGPFAPGRVIDLSQAAAEKIDMLSAGVVPVQLEILKTA